MKRKTNKVATNKPSDRLTSGFLQARQSDLVLQFNSSIVIASPSGSRHYVMRQSKKRHVKLIEKINIIIVETQKKLYLCKIFNYIS